MAKECKDFIFCNKKLSDIKENSQPKYIFVNFEEDSDIVLALERSMESGESNRYRTEPNYFYDKWDDTLPLEFNIVKNPALYHTQIEMEISKKEIREITRWLTSPHFPEWLKIESDKDEESLRYNGFFNNIETWTVGHSVYGLRLYFKCATPFAYTDDIVNEITVSTYKNMLVSNDSDELMRYCYPSLEINPIDNGQIYICNLSDCNLRENGTLELTQASYFDSMLDIVDEHARVNGCTVEYVAGKDENFNIVPLCDNTAVQFYLVDIYNNKRKCTAFYMKDTKEYRIIEGGFMYMTVYKGLKVYMDCQRLTINDELGRMVRYDKLGINDVDHMYWLRLINGHNSLLLYGNCNFTIKHMESRKVGE